MAKGAAICVLLVVAMAHLLVEPAQAISCADVASSLGQCLSYLTGADVKPAPACCDGIKTIRSMATTTADKRTACNCIKQAAFRFHNIKDTAVAALPNECGSPLSFPISTSFNCDTIP